VSSPAFGEFAGLALVDVQLIMQKVTLSTFTIQKVKRFDPNGFKQNLLQISNRLFPITQNIKVVQTISLNYSE
jgi:hypothetical protein